MDTILGVVTKPESLGLVDIHYDDDFADKLNHRVTVTMLIVFAVLVSMSQFVGDPINCWVPAHFSDAHEEYTNDYCWIKNTYFLPNEEYIPKEGEDRHVITYYQWVPLILLVMALLYRLPTMLWRELNHRPGVHVNDIVETSVAFAGKAQSAAEAGAVLAFMTGKMHRYLQSSKKKNTSSKCTVSCKSLLSRTCCRCCGNKNGNYMCAVYIVVKLLFVANIIFQFFALDFVLGHHYSIYGFDVLRAIINGERWEGSEKFPRVTLCDFKVRRLGNVQRYTVQCVLTINLFNEKIFLFIWFWMVFVAIVTILSLLQWTMRFVFPWDKYRFVKKHLTLMEPIEKNKKIVKSSDESTPHITKRDIHNKANIEEFVDEYLRPDGVFVLRLVDANTNAITGTSFVDAVWGCWSDEEYFHKWDSVMNRLAERCKKEKKEKEDKSKKK